MSDNYDSGFDLVLSDYERRDLIAHYETDSLPDYLSCDEEDMWYGYQIGDRMFDLNIWTDDMTGDIFCAVYECDWINDYWKTNCRHSWSLTGDEHE